jgi:hypothetical protein
VHCQHKSKSSWLIDDFGIFLMCGTVSRMKSFIITYHISGALLLINVDIWHHCTYWMPPPCWLPWFPIVSLISTVALHMKCLLSSVALQISMRGTCRHRQLWKHWPTRGPWWTMAYTRYHEMLNNPWGCLGKMSQNPRLSSRALSHSQDNRHSLWRGGEWKHCRTCPSTSQWIKDGEGDNQWSNGIINMLII